MKVLVVGSGGREHALVWKISQSPLVHKIFAAPGNTGMEGLAERVEIKASDLKGLLTFAQKEKIDLTVVGPELPLVNGIADLFESQGLKVFGPCAKAAKLEGSKVFSKTCMTKYGVPTAAYKIFSSTDEATRYVLAHTPPFVVKADGLAAGKGVIIAESAREGVQAIRQILEEKIFGDIGQQILVEEFLKGEELSVLAFTDGKRVLPLATSQDHKRAFDSDKGPNTGGMGAYSPCPLVNDAELRDLVEKTITPVVHGLASEGIVYRGLIYAGLMLTEKGPFVLEYNVRFGDPEAQAVLPRLDEDIVPVLLEVAEGRLREKLHWKNQNAITVVLASEGYPGNYSVGFPISGLEAAHARKDVVVFHAGTSRDPKYGVVTAGGRVLNVTAWGDSLLDARDRAYEVVSEIQFQGMFFRKDIGWRVLSKVH